ncbi:hypothetical protein SBY92_003162 [Candida maltosa Xu316]|uniref:SURP motif domain-containing protein n=1 Tax=Candida maltosa (strain Xu316) TaxID=1245528 RepID=M3HLH5_CANMX|nr:hypothetical protein G210_1173 [Candida maltosa Xu316]
MTTVPSDIKIPPEDIKQTIDKTAGYVIKNGKSFEERLLANNKNDKFSFINSDDENYPYYQWKLTTLQTQDGNVVNDQDIVIPEPRELSFLIDLPIITVHDLEVIKTTALYVAQNGIQQIPKILQHETKLSNRAQFEFLNKSHSLHGLFQKYITQYQKVLELYKSSNDNHHHHPLRNQLSPKENKFELLIDAYNRAQYIKQNKVQQKSEEEREKQRKLHYASIEWQDFSLVALIDFNAIDEVQELSIPLKRDDLVKRSLEAKSKEVELPKAAIPEPTTEQQQETSEQSSAATPVPAMFKGMKIKAAGASRLKKTTGGGKNTIKCPITGQLIPEAEFDTHIKTLLRDPKYKKEQENYIKKNFTYASNITTDQVYENIKRLVKKRSNNDEQQSVSSKRRS